MTYSSDAARHANAVQEKYEGEWQEGKMQGRGIYQYSDGSSYDGMWVAGKMHGKGTFTYPNGNRYDGEFIVSLTMCDWTHDSDPDTVSLLTFRMMRRKDSEFCNTRMVSGTRCGESNLVLARCPALRPVLFTGSVEEQLRQRAGKPHIRGRRQVRG